MRVEMNKNTSTTIEGKDTITLVDSDGNELATITMERLEGGQLYALNVRGHGTRVSVSI